MSHLSVRTLIEETVKQVDTSIKFAYARASDFNSIIKKGDNAAHLDTLSSSLEYTEGSFNLTESFNVAIIFYSLDDIQGAEKETAAILDKTDKTATKFIQKLNLKVLDLDQDVEILSIRKEPIIKATVSFMTGTLIRFSLVVPDDFNYCL